MNQTKTTPKDFFMYAGVVLSLYISTIAVLNLIFSIIDKLLPDKLYSQYFSTGSVAWPMSLLIVLIPILYLLEWHINKGIALVPEKQEIGVRRWVRYLTMFIAGAVIAGDLIMLVNAYLGGDLTSRFFFKIAAVFVVSLVIFAYYMIGRDMRSHLGTRKLLAVAGLVVVVGSIFAGFAAVGSPWKLREIRFDQTRISDINGMQSQIMNYWRNNASLPAALTSLNDSISGYFVPVDPESGAPYEYRVTGGTSFEICGSFSFDSSEESIQYAGYTYPTYGLVESTGGWNHPAGRYCFARTIDPEKYPPLKVGAPK